MFLGKPATAQATQTNTEYCQAKVATGQLARRKVVMNVSIFKNGREALISHI